MATFLLALLLLAPMTRAGERPGVFVPDPATVLREGPAYRYPQAGWIVIHVEGEPYDRGFQQGKLLAPEIAAYVRCFAATQSDKAPSDGWKLTRTLVNSLFLRHFDKEYLEEMRGIADGAAAAGAKFDGRNLDLLDIAALNCWAELMSLDWANDATPTGIEGIKFPRSTGTGGATALGRQSMHCSAFVATGPATADGKIVLGHISMFDLYPSLFFNIWLDVKPSKGHRIVMQTYPGGVASGMDWYMNDAGIAVCETTLDQTSFNAAGETQTSRIRKALQYGDSIDSVVEILSKGNNGLYTNEWLIADTKSNEIACFELGTKASKLYRSSKHDWFGETEGFYWGCNNAKDLSVRLDTIASTNDRPADMVFQPSDRDMAWVRLYHQYRGKIDADFGKLALSTPPLAAFSSLDAKVTTGAMIQKLQSFALFGPPNGKSWQPTDDEKRKFPEVTAMASNPWTTIGVTAPVASDEKPAVDLVASAEAPLSGESNGGGDWKRNTPTTQPSWRGTILPASDADAWLAASFAAYERIVDLEKSKPKDDSGALWPIDRDELGVKLYKSRCDMLYAMRRAGQSVPANVHFDPATDDWYDLASGRGVLTLHELRRILGDEKFEEMMDTFGTANAGKPITTEQFVAHVAKFAGRSMNDFFDAWIGHGDLPKLTLVNADARCAAVPTSSGYDVAGEVRVEGSPQPASIDVTVETEADEMTRTFPVDAGRVVFRISSGARPTRLVVDKYNQTAKLNGSAFGLESIYRELDRALIVYGTTDDQSMNRETAERRQRTIAQRWSNFYLPIRSDTEVTDDELKTHHLILIGRPSTNAVAARFEKSLPVDFGRQSFTVRGQTYGHMGSAIMLACANPLDGRYALLVFAGNSAAATLRLASVDADWGDGQAKVLINGGEELNFVIPSKELTRELADYD